MNIDVLVSTMHRSNMKLLEEMKITTQAIIINQCDEDKEYNCVVNERAIRWINSKERGLSKSRNMALKNSLADICIIADDDLEYIKDYETKILEAFSKYPQADIITFQVNGIEKKFKNYKQKSKRINYMTSMKISSVEIAFRRQSIIDKDIKFNELLGSGAKYTAGEESALLFECLKKGLKIYYYPEKIADLHMGESSWFKGYNEEYFINKGAIFSAMSHKMSVFLICQFALRKYKLYKGEISLYKSMKLMFHGRKQYQKDILNKV